LFACSSLVLLFPAGALTPNKDGSGCASKPGDGQVAGRSLSVPADRTVAGRWFATVCVVAAPMRASLVG
jgi:hypothetical protein